MLPLRCALHREAGQALVGRWAAAAAAAAGGSGGCPLAPGKPDT